LEDYGRFGQFVLSGGKAGGQPVLGRAAAPKNGPAAQSSGSKLPRHRYFAVIEALWQPHQRQTYRRSPCHPWVWSAPATPRSPHSWSD
ncbi:MAG TPA: hypothetical protein ENI30_14245, partial [Gammaproteobacteria bacterium]|nr:hypothetical protein [Gammaproteobacteria bacterium]